VRKWECAVMLHSGGRVLILLLFCFSDAENMESIDDCVEGK